MGNYGVQPQPECVGAAVLPKRDGLYHIRTPAVYCDSSKSGRVIAQSVLSALGLPEVCDW